MTTKPPISPPSFTLSSYTYVRNVVDMGYPVQESIESHLGFSDEVVVVNASPGDAPTVEILRKLQEKHGETKLRVIEVDVDWTAPNHGVFDGQCKAIAREECKGDWVCQFDVDEVLGDRDGAKIKSVIRDVMELPKQDSSPFSVAMPVVEYWGHEGRVRVDVNPWKWRLSPNDPNVTHGIPVHLRTIKNGLLYAMPGTDGCDLITKSDGAPVPCLQFMTQEVENLRNAALQNEAAAASYENWMNMVTQSLPVWFHFSWYSVENKISQYQKFWTQFWKSLYGPEQVPETNPFFPGKDLNLVSQEEIHHLAVNLEVNTGGWIFHQPWDMKRRCHIYLEREPPSSMQEWCDTHKTTLD